MMSSKVNPQITVLTATYNREKTLIRLFEALKNQTSFDFEWLIINDGSTDNSAQLLNNFKTENFNIRVYNQDNIGLNQTLNRGVQLAFGELIFRIDSDDYVTENAIETILKNKSLIDHNDKLCALVFLAKFEDGKIVGYHPFMNNTISNFFDYRYKHHALGDRAEVVKKTIYINYPFPKFGNEKFCHEDIMWAKMADDYDALYINQAIYIREYASDSITAAGVKTNINYPISAAERFKTILNRTNSLKYQFKYSIQYFRWSHKNNFSQIEAIKSVPFKSFVFGYILGYILHLIDKVDPYLLSKLKHILIPK